MELLSLSTIRACIMMNPSLEGRYVISLVWLVES